MNQEYAFVRHPVLEGSEFANSGPKAGDPTITRMLADGWKRADAPPAVVLVGGRCMWAILLWERECPESHWPNPDEIPAHRYASKSEMEDDG